MSVILVAATNSRVSINRRILDIVVFEGKYGIIDFLDYPEIPIFSKDIQEKGIPGDIMRLYEDLSGASKIVFFAPEHNGYISAYFKNIIDWMSRYRRNFLSGKKVILVSVSETMKEARIMEDPISKSFSFFDPLAFAFINFNRYGLDEGEDMRRAKEMVSFIEGF